jgi:probable phosphoglycerate mutase
MTRVVLVRHGESVSTVQRRIGGHRSCGGLSPLGVAQAERLRDRWREAPEFQPDVLVVSHYPRAQQTARIAGEAFPGVAVVEDDDFGEHDPGAEVDGLSYDEFNERYGPFDDWSWHELDPFDHFYPGGESVAAFHFRVGGALRRLTTAYPDGTALVVCHGGVIDAVLRKALRAPSLGGFEVFTRNTSITELETIDRNRWRLLRYNDSAHLAGLPVATSTDSP